MGWGGSEAAAAEGAVEPRREGERGGERKQGEGGREGARSEKGGGCLGRVNCFRAGRNPDNGKGEGSRSPEALRQTWSLGQPPAMTAEAVRRKFISQTRRHTQMGWEHPGLLRYWRKAMVGGRE